MRESAIMFGKHQSLVGILTTADSSRGELSTDAAAIITNAGLIHRVGPNRLHVHCARMLAELGLPTLRFDFSGVGDSPAVPHTADNPAVAECCEAMDFLEKRAGIRRFVAIGLCSGAKAILELLGSDTRVRHAILLNAEFNSDEQSRDRATVRQASSIYRRRMFKLEAWRRLISGKSQLTRDWRSKFHPRTLSRALFQSALVGPDTASLARLRQLDALETHMLLIYADHTSAWHSLGVTAGRFERELGALRHVEGYLIKDCDHLFTPKRAQQEVLQQICSWVRQQNGVSFDESPKVPPR